jgi:cytoskeleton protein RodZ
LVNEALPPDAAGAPYEANAAGDALRAAREAAGLSIEAVAQHLKLAPRQVAALENGSYGELPGRTFVRGFARNYARLLNLDADALVAALPDATISPAMEQPSLGQSSRGSPVFDERPRRRVAWTIPLLLVLVIVAGGVFELRRSGVLAPGATQGSPSKSAASEPLMAPALPSTATPLPNPLAASADAPATPSNSAEAPPLPITAAPATSASAPSANATLVIEYRASSWTDVRDAAGNRLLVGTMPAGSTQTITGAAPFDVVLGNVSHATVTWRGATVDTSAYHKQNVARLRLE